MALPSPLEASFERSAPAVGVAEDELDASVGAAPPSCLLTFAPVAWTPPPAPMSTGEFEGMEVTIPLGTPAPRGNPMTAGVVVLVVVLGAEAGNVVVEEAGVTAPLEIGPDEVVEAAELTMVVVTVDTMVVVI